MGGDEDERFFEGHGIDRLLAVGRGQTAAIGHDPDLQEMYRLGLRRVELAVGHTGAGAHELDLARADHGAVAQAVLVLERAVEDVGKDLHVAVAVGAEAGGGRHPVVVDHPQRPEAHVVRIVIVTEGEGVAAVQPAPVGTSPLLGAPDADHDP